MQDARCLVNATVRPVSGSIRVLSESTPRGYAIPPPARSLWLLLAPGLLFWYQGPHPPAMDTGVRRGSEHHGPVASVCKLVQSLRSLEPFGLRIHHQCTVAAQDDTLHHGLLHGRAATGAARPGGSGHRRHAASRVPALPPRPLILRHLVSGSLAPGKRPTHKLVLGPLPHTPKCPCVSPLGPMLAEGPTSVALRPPVQEHGRQRTDRNHSESDRSAHRAHRAVRAPPPSHLSPSEGPASTPSQHSPGHRTHHATMQRHHAALRLPMPDRLPPQHPRS